jgi:hypothetical protein
MLPTQEQVEEYLTSLADYVSQIPGQLPNFSELGEKVLEDIRRFGPLPSLPSVGNIPGLGAFEVPAPPPPPVPLPPPEISWHDGKRPWFIAAAVVGTSWRWTLVCFCIGDTITGDGVFTVRDCLPVVK